MGGTPAKATVAIVGGVRVSVADCGFASVMLTCGGLNEQVYPASANVPPAGQLNATVPVNPPEGVTVIVAVPGEPPLKLTGVGAPDSAKLGAPVVAESAALQLLSPR